MHANATLLLSGFFMRFAFSNNLPHLLAVASAFAPAAAAAAALSVAVANFPPIYSRTESLALMWHKRSAPPPDCKYLHAVHARSLP